jgi:hypothetical protein
MRFSIGQVGFMQLTPRQAPGAGASRPTIRCRAASRRQLGASCFSATWGNFYALDADTGEKLWGQKIGGAIGGGVITYETNGQQRVAVATGLTEVIWPSEQTTAKVSVLGVMSK